MTSPEFAGAARVPAYLNIRAGSAGGAAERLRADPRFDVREVSGPDVAAAIRGDAARGVSRVLICGGDGTVAAASATAVELGLELAIVPGGTLNHFARRLGIPTDVDEALDVAAGDHVRALDVGMLGDRLFLSTSSVGAYVTYVRLRDRAERWVGYHLASVVAAVRLLGRLRSLRVLIQVEGEARTYTSPLVFVGVGERRLATPRFGEPLRGGRESLHVLVVKGSPPARQLVRALAAAARGSATVHRTPAVSSHLVDECTVELGRPFVRIALDGEIHWVPTPLRYRIAREALRVVAPPPVERRENG